MSTEKIIMEIYETTEKKGGQVQKKGLNEIWQYWQLKLRPNSNSGTWVLNQVVWGI